MAVTLGNKVGYPVVNAGNLTDIDTVARNIVGTVVCDEYGGEFIYLIGVAACAANVWVSFTEAGQAVVLAADAVGMVGVALAAVLAANWGWFCIKSGNTGITGKCDTISANVACYIDGTPGRVDDATVSGDLILNCYSRTGDGTPSANLATFQIDHPSVNNILG